MYNDKSSLVLLVQNAHTIFCYYTISPIAVKQFEDVNGINSWKFSKPVLKVYSIQNGMPVEIKTIFIDAMANNWYICLEKSDIDVFVKLGRVLPDDTFIPIALSNTVTTPRDYEACDHTVRYVDVSQDFLNGRNSGLPNTKNDENVESIHREPKPYPLGNNKA